MIFFRMKKEHILSEIRRTAKDGKALGLDKFLCETGIKEYDWKGKYWVRWSDAVAEAGFEPNERTVAIDEDVLVEKYIGLIRELGHIPVQAEMRMKTRSDPNFPNDRTFFSRFGSKASLIAKVQEHCKTHEGYADIATLCAAVTAKSNIQAENGTDDSEENVGFVYLMKSGRHYKIGRANSVGRREYELTIQLPERPNTIHAIRTDDPTGIEAYWHKRFEAKRKNGEWFELDNSDITAFKRRKFM